MNTMYALSAVAAFALGMVFIPILIVGLFAIFALFALFFVLVWAVGGRITIRERGRVTGHIRWFKFHPKTRYDWSGSI